MTEHERGKVTVTETIVFFIMLGKKRFSVIFADVRVLVCIFYWIIDK